MKIFYVLIILSALIYTEAANNLWTAKEYQITIIELSHESEKDSEEVKSGDEVKIYHTLLKKGQQPNLHKYLLVNTFHNDGFKSPHLEIYSPPPDLLYI